MAGLPIHDQTRPIKSTIYPSIQTNKIQTLSAQNFHVKVRESSGDGKGHPHHRRAVHRRPVEEIKERSVFVVVGDEPQLSPSSVIWPFKKKMLI